MTTRKPTKTRKSALVWRISAEAPQGHWVDPTKSRDLLSGVDVRDDPHTVPDALFDELFPPKKDGPDDPGSSSSGQDGPSSP